MRLFAALLLMVAATAHAQGWHAGTPDAFDQYIRAQLQAVAELVAYLGLKPE